MCAEASPAASSCEQACRLSIEAHVEAHARICIAYVWSTHIHWSNIAAVSGITPTTTTGTRTHTTLVAHASDESVELANSDPVSHSVAVDDAIDTAVTVAPSHQEQHMHTTSTQQHAVLQRVEAPPPPPLTIKEQILGSKILTGVAGAGAAFLGGTFFIAVARVLRKYNSPKEKRRRTVDKNKVVMEGTCMYAGEGMYNIITTTNTIEYNHNNNHETKHETNHTSYLTKNNNRWWWSLLTSSW